MLLIFDSELSGLAGESETAAFDTLPDFPASEATELHRRDHFERAAGSCGADFATFCEQVGALQAAMGAYFAPLQGGLYASAEVGAVLDWLRGSRRDRTWPELMGADGICLRGVAGGRLALLDGLRAEIQHPGLSFELAQGRNEGAKIETSVDE